MTDLTRDDVVRKLKAEQGGQSLRKYAQSIGVSAAFLSDIYNGKREPGPKLLERFGLTKQTAVTTVYVGGEDDGKRDQSAIGCDSNSGKGDNRPARVRERMSGSAGADGRRDRRATGRTQRPPESDTRGTGPAPVKEVAPPEISEVNTKLCRACEEPLSAFKGKMVCVNNACGLRGVDQGSLVKSATWESGRR